MYGKIKETRLLNIEVYEGETLLYKGKVEDAPEEIKEKNYKSARNKGWMGNLQYIKYCIICTSVVKS